MALPRIKLRRGSGLVRFYGGSVFVHPAIAVLASLACLFVLIVFLVEFNTFFQRKNVESFVVNFMEENRRHFCEIDSIVFHSGINNATLKMTCNGRPFLAEYYNKSVNYEMNGWSWLKDTSSWQELSGCDYFKKENGKLLFICIEDNKTGFLHSFDFDGFSLLNHEKTELVDYALPNFVLMYPYLENCSLKDYVYGNFSQRHEISYYTFACPHGEYNLGTFFTISFPPGLFEDMSESEKQEHCMNVIGGKIVSYAPLGDTVICSRDTEYGELLFAYTKSKFPVYFISRGLTSASQLLELFGTYFLISFIDVPILEEFPTRSFLGTMFYSSQYGVILVSSDSFKDLSIRWREDGFYAFASSP